MKSRTCASDRACFSASIPYLARMKPILCARQSINHNTPSCPWCLFLVGRTEPQPGLKRHRHVQRPSKSTSSSKHERSRSPKCGARAKPPIQPSHPTLFTTRRSTMERHICTPTTHDPGQRRNGRELNCRNPGSQNALPARISILLSQ